MEEFSKDLIVTKRKLDLFVEIVKAQRVRANKLKEANQQLLATYNNLRHEKNNNEEQLKNAEKAKAALCLAENTISNANIQAKTKLTMSKQIYMEFCVRIADNEKKYDKIWLEAKERYEGLPYVKELMRAKNKFDEMRYAFESKDDTKSVLREITKKREILWSEDKKHILLLAQFIVKEMPTKVVIITEKIAEINKMNNELENIKKKNTNAVSRVIASSPGKAQTSEVTNVTENASFLMPKLHLADIKLGDYSVKVELDKVRQRIAPQIAAEVNKEIFQIPETTVELNDYISSYFYKPYLTEDGDTQSERAEDYSKRKLINILEDIKLDDKETHTIVTSVNPGELREVNVIGGENSKPAKRGNTPLESDEIEEVDMTNTISENRLVTPPFQYQDGSQDYRKSSPAEVEVIVTMSMDNMPNEKMRFTPIKKSPESTRKRVSFDLPMSIHKNSEDKDIVEASRNETIGSPLDTSLVEDTYYSTLKDMVLKKRKLDSSPQFVYAKNPTTEKKIDDQIVMSKFFNKKNETVTNTEEPSTAHRDHEPNQNFQQVEQLQISDVINDMDVVKDTEAKDKENNIKGYLYTHVSEGIIGSFDTSMNTTACEEDVDCPQYLDTSLLLSPKGDNIPNNSTEAGSQEMNSLFGGFQKTRLLSFFGQKSATQSNPETSNGTEANNFNFNFGGDEKKSKGNLFSFFR